MTTWLNSGSDWDETETDDCNGYCMGASSLPKMKQNRKRSSASAGLDSRSSVDSLVADFDRRLKLTPSAMERVKVADKLVRDPQFVSVLMKTLPEHCVRKLAITCSQWQTLAYETLRARQGNNAFSILWVDDEVTQSSGEGTNEFYFKMFFHCAHLGGISEDTRKALKTYTNGMPLETVGQNSVDSLMDVTSSDRYNSDQNCQVVSTAKVGFILTYGSNNMEQVFEQDENKVMKSANFDSEALLILSSSILVTTPDGKQVMEATSMNPDRKLMTSIMFPRCAHLSLEFFVVPPSLNETSPICLSKVVGSLESSHKAKALILYQYLNLIDSKPGIVEVLQTLKMTQESTGFPMVTGIYNYLDANLNTAKQSDEVFTGVVASGLLICGGDYCGVSVTSMNLLNLAVNETVEHELKKIENFFLANAFTTKFALLFYHNEATNANSKGMIHLKYFIGCFRNRLPDVKLHGIGSYSGAHSMFVSPGSNQTFDKLNERMMRLSGTVHSKTSPDSMELILVLLSYQAD